jgi:uncharacterized protein
MKPEPLRPVPLPDLLATGPRQWQVEQPVAGLDQAGMVHGDLWLEHLGDGLQVSALVHTELQLCCDRCLNPFVSPLRVEVQELLPLQSRDTAARTANPSPGLAAAPASARPGSTASTAPLAGEATTLLPDDLEEQLDPRGSFDPEHWLFEQISLRLPQVNRCGAQCPGPATWSSSPAAADPRWAALGRWQGG